MTSPDDDDDDDGAGLISRQSNAAEPCRNTVDTSASDIHSKRLSMMGAPPGGLSSTTLLVPSPESLAVLSDSTFSGTPMGQFITVALR